MKIRFTRHANEEFKYWQQNDPRKARRILDLLESIRKTPFQGIGKPEALRGNLSGYWSRRIDQQHRLVYKVRGTKEVDQQCLIIQCRFHYDD